MKMKSIRSIIILGLILGSLITISNCGKDSKDDPTVLAFLAGTSGRTPDPQEGACLGAITLANSCIGGTTSGEGINPAAFCIGTNAAVFGSEEFVSCIATAVTDSECSLPENKYTDAVVALDGTELGACFDAATATLP